MVGGRRAQQGRFCGGLGASSDRGTGRMAELTESSWTRPCGMARMVKVVSGWQEASRCRARATNGLGLRGRRFRLQTGNFLAVVAEVRAFFGAATVIRSTLSPLFTVFLFSLSFPLLPPLYSLPP